VLNGLELNQPADVNVPAASETLAVTYLLAFESVVTAAPLFDGDVVFVTADKLP